MPTLITLIVVVIISNILYIKYGDPSDFDEWDEEIYNRAYINNMLWDLSSCFGWDDLTEEEQIENFYEMVRGIKEKMHDSLSD